MQISPLEIVCMILPISYFWEKYEICFIMLSGEKFIQSDKC